MAGTDCNDNIGVSTSSSSWCKLKTAYTNRTPLKTKAIDAYLLFCIVTGLLQLVYCMATKSRDYRQFLGGFLSCVGSFVMAGTSELTTNDSVLLASYLCKCPRLYSQCALANGSDHRKCKVPSYSRVYCWTHTVESSHSQHDTHAWPLDNQIPPVLSVALIEHGGLPIICL